MIRKTQQIKNGKFLDLIKKKYLQKLKKKQIRKTASMSFESLKKKLPIVTPTSTYQKILPYVVRKRKKQIDQQDTESHYLQMLNYYLYRIKNRQQVFDKKLTYKINNSSTNNQFLKRKRLSIIEIIPKINKRKFVYSLFEDIYNTLLRDF